MLVFDQGAMSTQPDHEPSLWVGHLATHIDGNHEAVGMRTGRFRGWPCKILDSLPRTDVLA